MTQVQISSQPLSLQTTQVPNVLQISANRSGVSAIILECKASSPHETMIDFASDSLISTGSYPAEWRNGDQSIMGLVIVGFVLFMYSKQGIYLYGGSFQRQDGRDETWPPQASR